MSEIPTGITRNWGTCNAYDCDAVLPWDMAAVLVNGTPYCSPDCAKNADIPDVQTVGLHDPQFNADRPEHIEDSQVYFYRRVAQHESPTEVIQEVADMLTGEFRPTEK